MNGVLVLQHAAGEGPGALGVLFGRAGVPFRVNRVFDGDAVPSSPEGLSGLVLLGGPMSANDPLPWIAAEIELVRRALAARLPILGICLGAQLVARAAGGTVARNPVPEIGWFPVERVAEAGDIWFAGLPARFEAFHWHAETFTLPAEAALLLSSAHCPNQAFACDSALAVQCHLEMTEEMVRDWSRSVPADLAGSATVQAAGAMCERLPQRIATLTEFAEQVFARWIAHVQERA